jgi:hypothetical protein
MLPKILIDARYKFSPRLLTISHALDAFRQLITPEDNFRCRRRRLRTTSLVV